jgi:hypothetical protein
MVIGISKPNLMLNQSKESEYVLMVFILENTVEMYSVQIGSKNEKYKHLFSCHTWSAEFGSYGTLTGVPVRQDV